MKLMLATLTVGTSIAFSTGTALAKTEHRTYYDSAKRAVCHYFKGNLCETAMRIVRCETGGTYEPWAANGQYLGIWQMGTAERRKYGNGSNVWSQTRAAFKYYLDEVKAGVNGFSPWLNYEPPGCGG